MMTLNKTLRDHSRKAFFRNPMFERNLAVRIFMYFIFGILALELLAFSFFFDTLLLEVGPYSLAIHTFNSCVLYFLLGDFVMKFLFKKSQSMQIMPYLTLPIPKYKLYNYLLRKEFTSVWNLYPLFLLIPFALKAITPHFGIGIALLYILCFYLTCVGVSLLVNIANSYIERSGWRMFIPLIAVAAIIGIGFLPGINYEIAGLRVGEAFLHLNPIPYIVLLALLAFLWEANRRLMNEQVYRDLASAEQVSKASTTNLGFLNRFGEIGEFIELDIKMILRSKRLKQSLYVGILFIAYYFFMLYAFPDNEGIQNPFTLLFFSIFVMGSMGMIMGQYIFTSESSFFDGLMARHESLLPMLKGKYFLYVSYALIAALILSIAVFYKAKISLLFLVSTFFFVIGPVFFIMFLNAIFNKSYFNLMDGNAFSWKGTSGNTLMITMIGMFIPLVVILIIKGIFGENAAYGTMLGSGLLFTLTYNQWLKWIYRQFLKRKYKNMDGFRSN